MNISGNVSEMCVYSSSAFIQTCNLDGRLSKRLVYSKLCVCVCVCICHSGLTEGEVHVAESVGHIKHETAFL